MSPAAGGGVLVTIQAAILNAGGGGSQLGRDLNDAYRAVAELIAAARNASATLGHAYHTVLTGELAEQAHTDYQRLDIALSNIEGGEA